MSVILKIALKDLKRRLRSPLSVISMILIPIVLTVIIGMVFGGSGEVTIEGIKVLLADGDRGLASRFIEQGLSMPSSGKLIDIKKVDLDEGRKLIDRGKASALIIIPAGFTDSLLDGSSSEITVVENPSEIFLPTIVEEILKTEIAMIDCALDIFHDPITRFRSMLEGNSWPGSQRLVELVEASRSRIELVTPYLRDSLVTIDSEKISKEKSTSGENIYSFTFSGSIVFGLFFVSMIALGDILREKGSGTLKRVLTTPASAMQFVVGKALYNVLLIAVSYIILLAMAGILFKADFGDVIALMVLSIGILLVFPGILTFIYGIVQNERIVSSIVPVLIIGFCMIGGAMIPYEQMPPSLKSIAPYSPVFWVIDGMKKLIVFGGGLSDVALDLVVIYIVAFVSFACGILLIYSRIRKGV